MAMQKIYFATNRNPNNKTTPTSFGSRFNQDGMACLRFGRATRVEGKTTIDVAAEKIMPDQAGIAEDQKKCRYGSKQIFKEIQTGMRTKKCDVLVYIHGYNTSFKKSLKNAFELAEQFPEQIILVFSWPSDGSMAPWLAYASDRIDARASGPALGRAMLKLRDYLATIPIRDDCRQKIHLLAHSMGAYVCRHAVRYFQQQSSGLVQLLDQIILIAADEDSNGFEKSHKLKCLPEMGKRVSVYFNRQDLALAVSDLTKGNPERLGREGVRRPFGVSGKVVGVDCTEVVSGLSEHNYYRNNRVVITDLQAVLNGEQNNTITNRQYRQDQNQYLLHLQTVVSR